VLHHSSEKLLELTDGPPHIGDLTQISVLV
jgi:hypothetical protein